MNVQLPDNSVVQFPDGMPDDQINSAIQSYLGSQPNQTTGQPTTQADGVFPQPAQSPSNISENQQGNPFQKISDWANNPTNVDLSDLPSSGKDLSMPEKLASAMRATGRGLGAAAEDSFIKPVVRGISGLIADTSGQGKAPGQNIDTDELQALTMMSPAMEASLPQHAIDTGVKLGNAMVDTLSTAAPSEYEGMGPKQLPMSSDDIKGIASAHFAHADELGAFIPAEKTQELFSKLDGASPTTPTQVILKQRSPITQFLSDFAPSKDGPLSLSDAEGMYRDLGDRIDSVGLKNDGSYNTQGIALRDAQNQIRSFLKDSVTPNDVGGGQTGYEAWSNGQKSWSQAMKAQDLERIQARAELSANPTTAYQNGIKNLLLNNKKIGVYSEDEVAALKSAMKTGIGQDALNVFGSKLLPLGASMVGEATGGPLGAAILGGVAHVGSTLSRNAAANMKASQFGNALGQISSNVPAVGDQAAAAYARLLQNGSK